MTGPSLSPFKYRRVATATYEVRVGATNYGILRRTHEGWDYETTDGRKAASYGVSRDVAAAALRRLADQDPRPLSVRLADAAARAERLADTAPANVRVYYEESAALFREAAQALVSTAN